jgi:O-antigen/teichoic acid export membrane protein
MDVTCLEFLAPREEVGWYGAANNIASLALLLSPVLSWVLMPLFARTYRRSHDEFFRMLRRILEGIGLFAIPLTLLIALGADLWIRIAFGEDFAPAATSLRFLAPLFVATYMAMLLASALIVMGHSWRLTTISLVGMISQPVLIFAGVKLLEDSGTGGAGAGAALGVTAMELLVTTLFLVSVGRRALDARNLRTIGAGLGAAIAVAIAHPFLAPLGHVRLLLDMALWAALVVAVGGIRPRDVKPWLDLLLAERRAQKSAR